MNKPLDEIFALVITREAYRVTHTDGRAYIVSWVECYNDDELGKPETPPAYLYVSDEAGLQADYGVEKPVKLTAMAERVKSIREADNLSGEVRDMETISRLLGRVWSNEWMGQFNFGRAIYVNELADLLGIPMKDVWEVITEAVSQRKADVLPSTNILVPPQGKEPLKDTYDKFGHKEYSSSDFGWWACRSCGKSGDDFSDPADEPCA